MKLKTLDAKMRVFETAHDHSVLPGLYMIARLDGRGFTRLTRDELGFEAPYDERLRDHMVASTEALMRCGLHVIYGYTQSDEISLLCHRDDNAFGRKLRKLNSILAATATGVFSLRVGKLATFDCRISQLPTLDLVVDYFRWRAGDALRNALNAHCYWALRQNGATTAEATRALHGASRAEKNELLLRDHGINFNDVPSWHKRGVGLHWESYDKEWQDPETGETTTIPRKRIVVIHQLPMKDGYTQFIRKLVRQAEQKPEPGIGQKSQPGQTPPADILEPGPEAARETATEQP